MVEKIGLAWVSWGTICKPRELGGLGVQDIRNFNHALLSKWIWRIVNDEDAIWNGLMQARWRGFEEKVLDL